MTHYLDGPLPRAILHRGWHIGDLAGLENTLRSFQRGVDEGYRYLETDVHATSDGVLVAFHDSTLDRVTDGSGRVSDLTWDQLSTVRIGGREPIPRFADVLEALPHANFNVDPKTDAAVGPLIDAIAAAGAVDRICVGSFSGRRLATIRQAIGPELATSLAPGEVLGLTRGAMMTRTKVATIGAQAAQVPVRYGRLRIVTPRFIRAAHENGLEVHVWVVDEAAEMHRLLDLGVDGLMTDRPDVLQAVYTERDVWA
ncbi:glycerophosphodiester phosphodiesterase [Nakamurella lactea]|uniref:glycerophosphodiester phosphodiesterase n=1 Tax=Nakamurella lactea TaxID=459515 RepID=UPI0003F5B5E6|nr:glycerophosphodiester phosphodiesterase [Nakamurella lactea]